MKAKTLLDFWCISAFLIFVENCRKFLEKANCKGSYFVWSLINNRYRTQTSQKKVYDFEVFLQTVSCFAVVVFLFETRAGSLTI